MPLTGAVTSPKALGTDSSEDILYSQERRHHTDAATAAMGLVHRDLMRVAHM
ncbi:hypothetical protein [Salinibacter ruber]|uniref:hypothetical protein n=1 Tax=Salinibacter ruber TaxID=146919 RepID=UPI002169ED83|nr:hypothetical protein [Salinibacter ruber]